MSTAHRLITADELFGMPDDGYRYDLVRGELRRMAAAGFRHGAIGVNIAGPLAAFVRREGLGIVVGAETGFVLQRDPDTVLAPDVAFVSSGRMPSSGPPHTFFPGPPDLAVEVVSPGDRPREVRSKVEEYLQGGTKVVWTVDPRRQTVAVCRPGQPDEVFEGESLLRVPDVLPGFDLPLREIFG